MLFLVLLFNVAALDLCFHSVCVCVFCSVSSGFDGIREQNICNNIMAKLIQNYSAIFESVMERKLIEEKPSNLIIVKVSVDKTY